MTAAVPLDWQLTDTYFSRAPPLRVGRDQRVSGDWWRVANTPRKSPSGCGRAPGPRIWIMFAVGRISSFFPMHIRLVRWDAASRLQLSSGTRLGRVQFYRDDRRTGPWIGVVLFVVNVWISRRHGRVAGDNPWDGATLEWSVSSPPPPYNFAVMSHRRRSRYPLWEGPLGEGSSKSVLTR